MRTLFALMAGAFMAQQATAANNVTDYMLDNGLQVVVIEDNRAPVVVQMLWVKAASADEPPGKSGIAHYLEHLMFKGTETMAPGEFSATVAANGGTDNAFTSLDYTGYFQRVASDRLELVMRMEADRLRNLKLSDRDILTERDVVLEERKQRTGNNPSALFGEQRQAALYLNHPYGRPIIGFEHEIKALTLDDAYEFYRTYYAPNNAVLVVAGDVVPEEVYELAKTYYGPLEPTPGLGARERPQEPPQLAERRLIMEDPRTSEPIMVRTYLAPERDPGAQEEAAALTLLARVLGGNLATSYLGQKLVFGGDKVIFTSAFYRGLSYDDTQFGVYVVPKPGVSLGEAEAALDEALEAFMEEGIDPEQFARIKAQIRAAEIYAQDSTQGLARSYGAALTSGLTLADIEAWPDILQATTAEDVMSAAARVFDRRRAVTGWEVVMDDAAEEVSQ
jgi:zinc protease